MKIGEMKLKEVVELKRETDALFGGQPTAVATATTPEDHGIKIVIADRGWVFVGHVTTDAQWCYISKANNIRVWGTTKGLGELASGPLSSTKLDKAGSVKIAMRAVIGLIDVEEAKWKNAL